MGSAVGDAIGEQGCVVASTDDFAQVAFAAGLRREGPDRSRIDHDRPRPRGRRRAPGRGREQECGCHRDPRYTDRPPRCRLDRGGGDTVTPEVLSVRALNRATLARQLLLERATVSPSQAVHHLVGLQAQIPNNPYIGLWSRLADFDPMSVSALVRDRALVRLTVMRGTLHLVTADDCLLLRPLVQPVLDDERRHHRDFAPLLEGVDLEPVIAFGREVLSERASSGTELRAAMQDRFPDLDPGALAFACRSGLALVQVPPRGEWGRSSQVRLMTVEAFLGRPVESRPSIDEVVLRYLGAFGPATTSDISAWCRLRGMAEVVERLRPRLRVFRSERGRELFDLPEAPRPDPGVPAPIRFLPEYDNLWLSTPTAPGAHGGRRSADAARVPPRSAARC